MKKAKVIATVVIMLILILVILPVKAVGDFSWSVKMIPNLSKITKGDTVRIAVKLDNLTLPANSTGINTFKGTLAYNTNLFENIALSSDNGSVKLNKTKNIVLWTGDYGITESGETMFTISMTLKQDAADFDLTEINFTKIEVAGNEEKLEFEKVATTIYPKETTPVTPSPEPTATPTATPTAKPTATPTVKPSAAPSATPTVKPTATPTVKPSAAPTAKPSTIPGSLLNVKTSTTPKVPLGSGSGSTGTSKVGNKLPQTGIENTAIIVLITASVAICGVLFYKYKKYNNMMK